MERVPAGRNGVCVGGEGEVVRGAGGEEERGPGGGLQRGDGDDYRTNPANASGKTQQSLDCWVNSGRDVRAASERQRLSDAGRFQSACDYPHLATDASPGFPHFLEESIDPAKSSQHCLLSVLSVVGVGLLGRRFAEIWAREA